MALYRFDAIFNVRMSVDNNLSLSRSAKSCYQNMGSRRTDDHDRENIAPLGGNPSMRVLATLCATVSSNAPTTSTTISTHRTLPCPIDEARIAALSGEVKKDDCVSLNANVDLPPLSRHHAIGEAHHKV